MKMKPLVAIALLALCALPALASKKTSASLSFDQPVQVAQTKLQPGQYQVVWEGTGPTVEVSFLENNKVLAKAPARLEANASPYQEGFLMKTGAHKSKLLEDIYWKKATLDFMPGAGAKDK
jgi:hypothetical protein